MFDVCINNIAASMCGMDQMFGMACKSKLTTDNVKKKLYVHMLIETNNSTVSKDGESPVLLVQLSKASLPLEHIQTAHIERHS